MHDLLDQLAPEVDVDAAWEEVRPRLDHRRPARPARVLAIAAALALVAGGVVLATRSGTGDDADGRLTALGGGLVRLEVPDARIVVDFPEDWHHQVIQPEASGGRTVVLSTMPVQRGDDLTCDALAALGSGDAVVMIGRRGGEGPGGAEFLQPTGDLGLPNGTAGSLEYGDCPTESVPFATAAYPMERGNRGLTASVFIASGTTQERRDEVAAVLRSLLPDELTYRDHLHDVDITFPSTWQRASSVLTPHLGNGELPWEVTAVGTYPLTPNGPGARCAQVPVAALNQLGPTDALVWVYSPTGFSPLEPRPTRFTALPEGPIANSDYVECIDRDDDFAFDVYPFRENGLNLTAFVALGAGVSDETRAQTLQVLNSIQTVDDAAMESEVVAGLRIPHPGDWRVRGQLTDQLTNGPVQVAAIGTYELRHDPPCPTTDCRPRCADWPATAVEDLGADDVLIWVSESPPGTAAIANVPERRVYDQLPTVGLDSPCDSVSVSASYTGFEEGGRLLTVWIAVGAEASTQRLGQALDILSSIAVADVPTATFELDDARLTAQLPAGWEGAGSLTPPIRQPAGAPVQLAAFGTFPLRAAELDCEGQGCHADCVFWPTAALGDLRPDDALLWAEETFDLGLEHHDPRDPLYAELPSVPATDCPALSVDVRQRTFDDHGRRITTYATFGPDATEQTRTEALGILNSLQIDP